MKVSPVERLILIMLSDIQLALNSKFTLDSFSIRDAITYNQTWVLDFLSEFDGEQEATPELVIETSKILEMWSNIESSIKKLNKIDRDEIARDVGVKNCHFQGFYQNRDEHHIVSLILIHRLNRFTEFSKRSMSSSDPFSLERYRDMMNIINTQRLIFPLDKANLKSLLLCKISIPQNFGSGQHTPQVHEAKTIILSDIEWELIVSLLPKKSRGVPRIDDRLIFDAILWRFRSGRSWRSLPDRFGSFKTPYNRLKRWRNSGLWRKIVAVIHHLHGPELVLIDVDGNRTKVKDSDQILDRHVAWEVPPTPANARRTKSERHKIAAARQRKTPENQPMRTIGTHESSIDHGMESPHEGGTSNLSSSMAKIEVGQNTPGNKSKPSIDRHFQPTQDEEQDLSKIDINQQITVIRND